MDLSYPSRSSVNSGIAASSYLNEPYKLGLPGIDRLCQFILQHGRGCLLYKKDLRRAYRQIPIDPKDSHLLGFTFNGRLYFDTRCSFGLRTSAMICQRTTSAVIYIFKQSGYTADVYLDDFYGAEHPDRAFHAFHELQSLFDSLGLQASPEKDCPPATTMICLGIEVDTNTFCLRVPRDRLDDSFRELSQWKARTSFRLKRIAIPPRKTVFRHSMCQVRSHFCRAGAHCQAELFRPQALQTVQRKYIKIQGTKFKNGRRSCDCKRNKSSPSTSGPVK